VSKSRNDSSTTTKLQDRQQFRFDRSVAHLKVKDPSMVINTDKRIRGKNTESGVPTTRATTTQQQALNSLQDRETSYIANWHYPPEVIQKCMYDQPNKVINRHWPHAGLTDEYFQEHLVTTSGYSLNDRYPSPYKHKKTKENICYPILPTYNIHHAYNDYKLAWEMKNGREYTKELNAGESPISPDDNCIEVDNSRRSSRRITIQSDRPMDTIQEEDESNNSPSENVTIRPTKRPRSSQSSSRTSKKLKGLSPHQIYKKRPKLLPNTWLERYEVIQRRQQTIKSY